MKTQDTSYLGVELKFHYFDEFVMCGLPIPPYSKDQKFVLKFSNPQCYLNYCNVLVKISKDLDLADPQNSKYDIQHSKAFINNILFILKEQFSKKYS